MSKTMPTNIIIKLLKTKDEGENHENRPRKGYIIYWGAMALDFSSEIMKARRQWNTFNLPPIPTKKREREKKKSNF